MAKVIPDKFAPITSTPGMEKSATMVGLKGPSIPPPPLVATGKPLEIPLSQISEDPDQPRRSFDEKSLAELAANIKAQGVLQAISVRTKPGGGYIINSGARRFRASVQAGKTTIPALVQENYDVYAQMAENIHREDLTPLEEGKFILARIAVGESQREIASGLNKSPAWVAQRKKVVESPEWLQTLYTEGKCRDTFALYELARLEASGEVEDLKAKVTALDNLSRSEVQALTKPKPADPEVPEPFAFTKPEPLVDIPSTPSGSLPPAPGMMGDDEKEKVPKKPESGKDGELKESKSKEPKEPKLEKVGYVANRKCYLQTTKIKVFFPDSEEWADIPIDDVQLG